MQTYAKPAFYIGATAAMLNRHVDTVRRWCDSGKMGCGRDKMSGWRIFTLDEINRVRAKMALPELSPQQATKIWRDYHNGDE